MQIVQSFPQYSVAQHLVHATRRKTDYGETLYHWDDEKLLKKIEAYRDELEKELTPPTFEAYAD